MSRAPHFTDQYRCETKQVLRGIAESCGHAACKTPLHVFSRKACTVCCVTSDSSGSEASVVELARPELLDSDSPGPGGLLGRER